MSTIIQIKRSSGTSKPAELAQGELAYSYGVGGSFGEQLFIGTGTETDGVAASIDVIGGKYFTDRLDHAIGTLTASSAILVDANKAIDELFIGNNVSTGGTIKFNEGTNNGTNFIALKAPNSVASDITFTLPSTDGSSGEALITNGSGVLSFSAISGNLTIADDTSTTTTINLGTDTLTIAGGTGITSTISGDIITLAIDNTVATASSTNTFTNKTIDANGTGNSITNLEVADFAGSAIINVAETLASNDSDTALVTAGAIIDYVDAQDANIASDTLTFTNKSFDANGTGNSITNLEVADFASGVIDTDISSVSASDDTLASAKAIKTYVDNQVANQMTTFTIADDSSTTSTITQNDTLRLLGGTGISSTVSGDQVTFAIDNTVTTNDGSQTLTNKTLTTPIISSISNSGTLTLPTSTDTLVGRATTDTLTNKTINSASNTITITEANISDLGAYITASSSDTLTNKIINASQLVDGSVTNAKLANSSITLADNSSTTTTIGLGETLKINGTANEIETTITGDTITIGLPNDVTVANNLTITGNLTVNGTTTTISTTNTVASDTLFELGNGTTGSPANDSGIIIERGDSDNAFIGFDESADKFIVGTTTATGASTGNLTITTGTLVANLEATTATLGGSDVLSTDNTKTVTNKTISGSSNTLQNIGNASLVNSSFSIFDETSTSSSIALGGSLQITGGEGIDTSIVGNIITIAGELATTSNKGVASFSSDNFTVSSGAVTVTAIDGGTF
jgi:hypothetical protein